MSKVLTFARLRLGKFRRVWVCVVADSPDVVAPHGGEHQEVRDEHEGDGEQDHLDQP